MASSLAASGLLFPRIRTASSRPPRLATQSRVRLLPAATSAARAHLRFVAHRTASAPSGISNDTTGLDDGVAEDGDDIDEPELPWWAPSIEELIEFDKTDFSPRAIEERFVRESKEAAATVKGAAAGLLLRPLRDLFDDVRKFKSVFDIEEFHIGLPLSALMACVAAYHVWKAAPSACIDFVLHYGFYRLCVMAAGIRRRGFATDMIIRLKLCQLFISFW
nr:unnamed protein product [Digitaria exilis]